MASKNLEKCRLILPHRSTGEIAAGGEANFERIARNFTEIQSWATRLVAGDCLGCGTSYHKWEFEYTGTAGSWYESLYPSNEIQNCPFPSWSLTTDSGESGDQGWVTCQLQGLWLVTFNATFSANASGYAAGKVLYDDSTTEASLGQQTTPLTTIGSGISWSTVQFFALGDTLRPETLASVASIAVTGTFGLTRIGCCGRRELNP